MVRKGNHPQMALIQVSELFQFSQILFFGKAQQVLKSGLQIFLLGKIATGGMGHVTV